MFVHLRTIFCNEGHLLHSDYLDYHYRFASCFCMRTVQHRRGRSMNLPRSVDQGF